MDYKNAIKNLSLGEASEEEKNAINKLSDSEFKDLINSLIKPEEDLVLFNLSDPIYKDDHKVEIKKDKNNQYNLNEKALTFAKKREKAVNAILSKRQASTLVEPYNKVK
jgi:hypothetical protein